MSTPPSPPLGGLSLITLSAFMPLLIKPQIMHASFRTVMLGRAQLNDNHYSGGGASLGSMTK